MFFHIFAHNLCFEQKKKNIKIFQTITLSFFHFKKIAVNCIGVLTCCFISLKFSANNGSVFVGHGEPGSNERWWYILGEETHTTS